MSNCSATPWTVAPQAPLSTAFPRQEYWSELPFPSPRDRLNPGTEPMSPASAGGFFTTEPWVYGKKQVLYGPAPSIPNFFSEDDDYFKYIIHLSRYVL